MRYHTLATLLAVAAAVNANPHNKRHHDLAKRQATTSSSSSAAPATTAPQTTSTAAPAAPTTTSTSAPPAGPPPTSAPGAPSAPVSSNNNPAATLVASQADIPPLASISLGMPTGTSLALTTTYAAGSTPSYSHAPALPSAFVFTPGEWPAQDKLPDTNSDEVKQWMKELDGWNIPNIAPTVDGTCVSDPTAAGEAQKRGWWTCGGWTQPTDILACPDKLTWGVSFDDGPSPYSTKLLKYLAEKDISATFFVVGSRVIERPAVLVEEYMSGHEISVHTWSHPHLTTLTNEQVVAELGWARKSIKSVLGITPTTMRPPYGDIDDRVRAIAMAMGMVPIIWTRTPSGNSFDTFDWRVAGGLIDAPTQYANFQSILGNATTIDTGFIVLQHDLFEITVDLAVGYTLNAALTHNPPFKLESIGQCSKIPTSNLYRESNTNTTFPFSNATKVDVDGDGKTDTSNGVAGNGGGGSNSASSLSASLYSAMSLAGLAVLGALL